MLELRLLKGPSSVGQSFKLELGKTLTLGREDGCEIQLLSKGISKRHCRITVLAGSRVQVEDLKSSNGTFVNGVLVKKHILQPGDSLNVHEFTLQLVVRAPEAEMANVINLNVPSGISDGAVSSSNRSLGQSLNDWFAGNIYPWADKLSSRFDVRALVVVFFLIWSTIIIFLTASPFSSKANLRVQEQAIEVGHLYARQLVRLNQQAIIDQRYRDLIAELDDRPGRTPGVINALILDASSAQVLAPSESFGQALGTPFAIAAINKDVEFAQVDSGGLAYVSAPIKIGTANGNRTAATALVVIDTRLSKFTIASLIDQVVNSLLISLLVSILFLIFIYRWIEGSLNMVSAKVDIALKESQNSVQSEIRWPALTRLIEQISSALGRTAGSSNFASASGSGDWALAAVNNSTEAAAAFSKDLVVIAWNQSMEQLIGIRAKLAVGSDISGASRDVAFESMIRDLAAQTPMGEWIPIKRDIEFGGNRHSLSMVYGQGAYLVQIGRLAE